jgi:hypothetical protein
MASVCCFAKVFFGGICSKCGEPCDEQFFLEADEDGVWFPDENGERADPNNDLKLASATVALRRSSALTAVSAAGRRPAPAGQRLLPPLRRGMRSPSDDSLAEVLGVPSISPSVSEALKTITAVLTYVTHDRGILRRRLP